MGGACVKGVPRVFKLPEFLATPTMILFFTALTEDNPGVFTVGVSVIVLLSLAAASFIVIVIVIGVCIWNRRKRAGESDKETSPLAVA